MMDTAAMEPQIRRYRVLIDGAAYESTKKEPTAWELLVLAGISAPEDHILYTTGGGHATLLEADDRVDLAEHPVCTFISRRADAAQGLGKGRREVTLPASDTQWLDSLGLVYETMTASEGARVVLYRCPVPTGYTVDWADIDFVLEPHYPRAPVAHVGFSPALTRRDGKAIRATCEGQFDGRTWQCWNRERGEDNPWRSSLDGLPTQFVLVEDWLSRELRRI